VLRHAPALWGFLFAAGACAQVSGSLNLVSDYRYRGVSLSDEKPAAQLSVVYDHASGWYAGVFGSTVEITERSRHELQLLSYVGYAGRLRPGLTWEAGAAYTAFLRSSGYDYPEVYLGIASEHASGRLSYAQDYYGQGGGALYAELNGTRPLVDRVHLLGHLGVLRLDHRDTATGASGCCRFDVRAGIALDLEPLSLQLAWVASGTMNSGPASEDRHRNVWVLSASRAF
jgi:uncharacterized protein (TIGR02001 family)